MWQSSVWNYIQTEGYELVEWAKCGDSYLSVLPTVMWAVGAAALSQRLLTSLFRRFLFRRVPIWELVLQNLLFVWMLIYSLHLWMLLVRIVKLVVEYFYDTDDLSDMTQDELESERVMQQWVIWMCGAAPLVVYVQTRPRPEAPPFMLWITTSPWQRREMGPYGYYLNRPLTSLQTSTAVSIQQQAMILRRAYSDSKLIIKVPPKKKRYSKSV